MAKAAPKKSTGKAMAPWDEELARRAAIAAGMEANAGGGGNFIGTRGGVLSYMGSPVPGNKFNVIVLDHILENAYYGEGSKFDADNPLPPVCFAFGTSEDEMKPHEDSEQPQADTCADCEWNKMGSAETGKGKACKNIRRLALITEDALDSDDSLKAASPAFLKTPVTSTGEWAGYVKNLFATFKRPPLGVITEISAAPHPKFQFQLGFKLKEQIEGSHIQALLDKADGIQDKLWAPYTPADPEDRNRPPARGRSAAPPRGGKLQGKQAPASPQARGRTAAPARSKAPAKAPAKPAARGRR